MDQVQKKITDDLWSVSAMESWYAEQVQMLCHWLTERLDRSLHPYQCTCLAHIVKVISMISHIENFYIVVKFSIFTHASVFVRLFVNMTDVGSHHLFKFCLQHKISSHISEPDLFVL